MPKSLTNFTANKEFVFPFRCSSGENVNTATILELQFLAKLVGRERKVAHGDVSLPNVSQGRLQLLFVHRRNTVNPETSSGEIADVLRGEIQVRVLCYLLNGKSSLQRIKTSRLHQRGIRFVEVGSLLQARQRFPGRE